MPISRLETRGFRAIDYRADSFAFDSVVPVRFGVSVPSPRSDRDHRASKIPFKIQSSEKSRPYARLAVERHRGSLLATRTSILPRGTDRPIKRGRPVNLPIAMTARVKNTVVFYGNSLHSDCPGRSAESTMRIGQETRYRRTRDRSLNHSQSDEPGIGAILSQSRFRIYELSNPAGDRPYAELPRCPRPLVISSETVNVAARWNTIKFSRMKRPDSRIGRERGIDKPRRKEPGV